MSKQTGIEAALVAPSRNERSTVKITINMIDPEGEVAVETFYLTGATGTTVVDDLLDAAALMVQPYADMSQSQVQSWSVTFTNDTTRLKPPDPASGSDNIEDKVFLVYSTDAAFPAKMNVPTPKPAVFLSDGETVNPSSVLVLAWSTAYLVGTTSGALTLTGATAQGNPVQNYIKGYFRRAKTRRVLRQGISTEIGG